MTPPIHCMGGWCEARDRCACHYSPSPIVSERLCPKGEPRPIEIRPIAINRQEPADAQCR